jgi:hypothetical protein
MLAVESDEVEKATSSLTEFPQSLRLLGIKMTLLAKNVSVAAVDDVVGLFGCSVLISSLHRAIVVDLHLPPLLYVTMLSAVGVVAAVVEAVDCATTDLAVEA